MKLPLLRPPMRNQFFVVVIANIITFTHGSIVGWLSPALLHLNSEDTPLISGPMSPDEVSWVASSICIGGTVGVFFSGFILSKFGNRIGLISLALPHFFYWALIVFGNHYHHLVIARTIVGLTGGALFRVIPFYIADIAQSDIRGMLSSISPLMYNSGMLMGFILGGYVSYDLIPYSVILSVSYVVIILVYIPETPQHLFKRGDKEKAYTSLLFYRTVETTNVPEKVKEEFLELKQFLEFMEQEDKISWRACFTKEARFGFAMAIVLSLLVQFSGTFSLMQFTAQIFQESGSSLAPNQASIIVATLQMLGNCMSVLLVERLGRRILLLVSCLGTALGLMSIGTYSLLADSGYDVTEFNWIPVAGLSLAIFIVSVGIVSLVFTVPCELLPPECKDIGLTIAMGINPVVGFFILKAFPLLLLKIHLYGIMYIFAISCLIGMVVLAIYLPETKGKNLNKV